MATAVDVFISLALREATGCTLSGENYKTCNTPFFSVKMATAVDVFISLALREATGCTLSGEGR